MLKQRLLTAVILLPLVIWGIISLESGYFSLMLGLFVVLGAWEWSRLAGMTLAPLRVLYTAVMVLLLAAAWWLWLAGATTAYLIVLGSALLWWLIALIWVLRFPDAPWADSQWLKLLVGLWVLVPPWLALVILHGAERFGPWYVLGLLTLIWLADSGAYFVGRACGRRKLAPAVSPGKTWEGVAGALAVTLLWSIALGYWLQVEYGLLFVLLSLVTVVSSILGDLSESMFKRQVGIKDSGTIFPGHGGVLDRIDSLTSAAPLFTFGLLLLEKLA